MARTAATAADRDQHPVSRSDDQLASPVQRGHGVQETDSPMAVIQASSNDEDSGGLSSSSFEDEASSTTLMVRVSGSACVALRQGTPAGNVVGHHTPEGGVELPPRQYVTADMLKALTLRAHDELVAAVRVLDTSLPGLQPSAEAQPGMCRWKTPPKVVFGLKRVGFG